MNYGWIGMSAECDMRTAFKNPPKGPCADDGAWLISQGLRFAICRDHVEDFKRARSDARPEYPADPDSAEEAKE